jgi:hypothetical protein
LFAGGGAQAQRGVCSKGDMLCQFGHLTSMTRSLRPFRTSPTSAVKLMSTALILPSSLGSTSTCTMNARFANCSTLPVTRSSNLSGGGGGVEGGGVKKEWRKRAAGCVQKAERERARVQAAPRACQATTSTSTAYRTPKASSKSLLKTA